MRIAYLGPAGTFSEEALRTYAREIRDGLIAAGIDQVEFWVRTNPGTRPGPMMKVASGGELSRFLLALKVVLAARGSAPTLVFDEADAGVGGATAATRCACTT